jgi:hypothetical protein
VIAAALNELGEAGRWDALTAVCEWFWRSPDGPVQSNRIKPSRANPGNLAKRVTSDLTAAAQWWSQLGKGGET